MDQNIDFEILITYESSIIFLSNDVWQNAEIVLEIPKNPFVSTYPPPSKNDKNVTHFLSMWHLFFSPESNGLPQGRHAKKQEIESAETSYNGEVSVHDSMQELFSSYTNKKKL